MELWVQRRCFIQVWLMTIACFAVSACKVGPNFHKPLPPPVATYTYSPQPKKTASIKAAKQGGVAQHFIYERDLGAEWWRLFRSRDLNTLVEIALDHSPTLAAAEAALRQSEELLIAQIGGTLFPQFNFTGFATRERISAVSSSTTGSSSGGATATASGSASGRIFNLYNASINVSYTFDFFGGLRRQIEALAAQVDFQQYQVLAAYLTLTSNVVTTAITIASLEEQIEATKQLINDQAYEYHILLKQFKLGGISQATVLTQETLLSQTRALLGPLEKNLAAERHALAVLLGLFPNAKLPRLNLETLHLPSELPVTLPSCLVRQRPDVLASEALLHVASAQIGVATANLLPQFPITGSYGWEGIRFPKLFSPQNLFWLITAGVTQPIFEGGALWANRRAAIAAYQQAAEQYRGTVLGAFQNVADALRALEADAKTLRADKQAELASGKALKLIEGQYRLGGVSYISLLIAQTQYRQAYISRIIAQASRYTNTVALYQALGGGWWNLPCAPCAETYGMKLTFTKKGLS